MAKQLSWAVRIERAEKRGRFTAEEISLARDSWRTCAVGEKHGWLWDYERSEDEWTLGDKFGLAVAEQDFTEARQLYEEIMALPV